MHSADSDQSPDDGVSVHDERFGAVLDELIELRAAEGLTVSKLNDPNSAICKLPSVLSEQQRGIFNSPAAAAYEVVKSTIDEYIPNSQIRPILVYTLNLEADLAGTLTRRRGEVQKILTPFKGAGLGVYKNNYDAREKAAYEELAFLLVSLRSSPCSTPLTELPVTRQALPYSVINEMLHQLADVDTVAGQAELLDELLVLLPGLRQALDRAYGYQPGASRILAAQVIVDIATAYAAVTNPDDPDQFVATQRMLESWFGLYGEHGISQSLPSTMFGGGPNSDIIQQISNFVHEVELAGKWDQIFGTV